MISSAVQFGASEYAEKIMDTAHVSGMIILLLPITSVRCPPGIIRGSAANPLAELTMDMCRSIPLRL